MRHFSSAAAAMVGLIAGLFVGCTEQQPDAIAPQLAKAKPPRTLTVTGSGTGSGIVSAPAIGESGAFECSVNAGVTDPPDCSRVYAWKAVVELTATALTGSSFAGWTGACTGTSPVCRVSMTESRSVRAAFSGNSTPSFTLSLSGDGTGSGTVRSQAGLTPAIDCTITSGAAASSGCTATYPRGTAVSLTSTPASGSTFSGWSGDCTGTTCSLTIMADMEATATFDAPPGPEVTMGRWDPAQSTPIIGVHVTQLPNGRTLLWGHAGEPQLWDGPGTAFSEIPAATCINPAICEFFCAGHTWLSDGRLLVAGGHNEALGDEHGITNAATFDGSTWQATGSMSYPRWYPTLVTLANGDVLAIAGNTTPGSPALIPERYSGGTWTPLTGISANMPMYPRAFVEPKFGRVYVPDGPSRMLDATGTGSFTAGPYKKVYDRYYGAAVMFDTKMFYVGGGGASGCPTTLPRKSAEIIDLAAPTPVWAYTDSMQVGRRQHNATLLPDGSILVTGGTGLCGFTNEAGAVYAAELWSPVTGRWTQMASATAVRVYHSTTILLADGRVVSTGSGDGAGVTQQYTYEVFSPPYLFKGARPTYTKARRDMHYGQAFTISSPNAAAIRKVTIVRLNSSTHAFDMGQRLNTLPFQVATDGQSIVLTPPAEGKLAPPGPYWLFILNDQGVPSVGQTILLTP